MNKQDYERNRILEWVNALTASSGLVSAHWLREAIISGDEVNKVNSVDSSHD